MDRLTKIHIWRDVDFCDKVFTVSEHQVKSSNFIVGRS